ncbi:cytochrome c [Nitratiruptor sp. YY09-18]|uniref:c-type cytochrome n=1 Tax=Nitratiruptor sp. YY09-18 TaxID=2724901 RepID=UPI0019156711|nr:cytochrome c [Nitratiruptor sp. YY09-18]
MENKPSVWTSNRFWRRSATWVTGVSAVLLILLTVDSMSQMQMGTAKDIQNKVDKRIPSPLVINYKIDYQLSPKRGHEVPIIGGMDANGKSKYEEKEKFFGRDDYTEEEARALIHKGKLTIQAKNCMDCHTLLGNGAYYAPDLTKAWLDPAWNVIGQGYGGKEYAMAAFLQNPPAMAMHERKMPNLGITKDEAKAVVAYLKFMSAIDTNGFPRNFGKIKGAVNARK